MSQRDGTGALVEVILWLMFAVVIGVAAHYITRGIAWGRYCGDDPELYALTDREHTMFVVGAYVFPMETALVFVGFVALAIGVHPGFSVGAATFGVILGICRPRVFQVSGSSSSLRTGSMW